MTETNTTTKPEQKKSEKSLKEVQELFLDLIDQAENTDDPDEREYLLHHCGRLQKELMDKNKIFIDMMIGLRNFEKQARRRATRKPLTVRRARSLAEDLHQLVTILNI